MGGETWAIGGEARWRSRVYGSAELTSVRVCAAAWSYVGKRVHRLTNIFPA